MKLAVITGGNAGLGYALAEQLCKQGNWHVIIASRNIEKANAAVTELSKTSSASKVEALPTPLDLLSQKSVRDYVDNFPYPQIDLLVLNAGASIQTYRKSEEGIEASFAGNHLGHFHLTLLFLSQKKVKSSVPNVPARIVTVSSSLHNPKIAPPKKDFDFKFDFDNLKGEKFDSGELVYDGGMEYRRTKLANVWFAYELDRYLKKNNQDIISVVLCPGFVPTTGLKRDSSAFAQFMMNYILPLFPFTISLDASSKHMLYACTSDKVESGCFYHPSGKGAKGTSSVDSYDEGLAKKCWNVSAQLVGLNSFVIE